MPVKVLLALVTAMFAPARVAAPVPPLATGRVPVTLVAQLTNVVDVVPVPPLATGNALAVVSPYISEFQDAADVPLVDIQVHKTATPAATVVIVFKPDD